MKKYVMIGILYLMAMFIFLPEMKAIKEERLIYLDPGHGGKDGGAFYNGIHESDINLKLCNYLKTYFEFLGYDVLMTRDGDYDLATQNDNRKAEDIRKRVELINKSNCLLFISVHQNSYHNSIYKGAQTFYTNNHNDNKDIAEVVLNSIKEFLNNTIRKPKKTDDIYLISNVNRRGFLIETGFMTNTEELKKLCSEAYLEQMAIAICYGVKQYFST